MSTLRKTIKSTGKDGVDLDFTSFAGPEQKGEMLQITQGLGTVITPDEPGFIQLTKIDAYRLLQEVAEWLRDTTEDDANRLADQIAKDRRLENTIFQEAVNCQHFISDLKVLDIPIRLIRML